MCKRLALSLCFIALATIGAKAQAGAKSQTHDTRPSSASVSDEVWRQLLSMPAPTPRTSESKDDESAKKTRTPEFFDETKPPADDAPDEEILTYWERWAGRSRKHGGPPTDAVKSRILAACEAKPDRLPRFLSLLPDTPDAAERVKKLYDAALSSPTPDPAWQKYIHDWLRLNSNYFLSELLNEARTARDKNGYVDGEGELSALAKFDWDSAEPLLRSFSTGAQPRTAALALALLHRHALEAKDASGVENFRARLQAIAADRNAPAYARNTAVEELSMTEWAGRDEWYLSLFSDETLREPVDGSVGFNPLNTLFWREPDKWIPMAAKMVESKDDAVRVNAASCLVKYAAANPRRDAILPVLRWLTDPDWLDIGYSDYSGLISSLDKLEMPESVPALIWVVEHDGGLNASFAALTLAHYKDPRAVPAMKKALAEQTNETYRQNILQGLIASGGLTEAEMVAGLEAYAAKLNTPGGREALARYYARTEDEALPIPVSIGNYLAKQKDAPDSLVRAALARAEVLRKSDPERARALLGVIEGWQAKQIEVDILRRIGSGSADATLIANALERRAKLRESVAPELQILAGAGGATQGIAAVLLEDDALARTLLESRDVSAQVALLACARLTQMSLPVAQVGLLLRDKRELLATAAERYLLAEDSREARDLLLSRHPNEAFVTGWRDERTYSGGVNYSAAMSRAEDKLRAELFRKDDAPLEIFALLDNDERPSRVIRVYARGAIFTRNEDASRYVVRALTPEELNGFQNFVKTNNLLDLGPQIGSCHYSCFLSEFLNVTREGGRRIFSHQAFGEWLGLLYNFDRLVSEGATIHYNLEDEIKGLEILFADKTLSVKDVWRKGDELRVLVERVETPEELARKQSHADDDDEDDDDDGDNEEHVAAVRAKHRAEWLEGKRARISWRVFANGKLRANAVQPEGYSPDYETWAEIDFNEFPYAFNKHPARAFAAGFYVLAGNTMPSGLWKMSPGQRAVRISGEGEYANPLVTPDGAWAVAAKADVNWERPNTIVRFDLRSNREYTVNVPPARQFEAVAYVAAHGKFLLRRARDEAGSSESSGTAAPEFYLLDAATGRAQKVSGVFDPLFQEGARVLQPTGNTDEVWAAIPDRAKNETRVSRYNLRDFSFQTVMNIPHISFDSFQMWVDEAGGKLLVIYRGQLLRMPLQKTPATTQTGAK